MGRDVISPVGGAIRRICHTGSRLPDPHSRRRIGGCADNYDGYGHHQPHGVGIVSEVGG